MVLLIWCVKNSSAAVPREKNWNRPVPVSYTHLNIESKHAVIRYMKDHAREKDTAAWLAQEYGGSNSKMCIRDRRRSAPVPITFEAMAADTDGYFSADHQKIAIRQGMSEVQKMCIRDSTSPTKAVQRWTVLPIGRRSTKYPRSECLKYD